MYISIYVCGWVGVCVCYEKDMREAIDAAEWCVCIYVGIYMYIHVHFYICVWMGGCVCML